MVPARVARPVIAYRPSPAPGVRASSREEIMRVVVDFDLCESNAVCMEVCSDVFKVDEQDMLHILVEKPGEDYRAKIEDAVRLCPRQAISIAED